MKQYRKKSLTPETRDAMVKSLAHYPKKMSSHPVCDFCGEEEPVVVYAASQMSTGLNLDCWRWCACKDCEALLDFHLFDAVIDRIVDRMDFLTGRAYSRLMIRTAALASFQAFLDYVIEEEKPEEPQA